MEDLRMVKNYTVKRKPHRATGMPRGRPKVHPADFDRQIFDALCRRMDATTRKVIPHWNSLVKEFHIGRNTLAKAIKSLKDKGLITNAVDYSYYGTDTSGTVYLLNI